MTPPTAAMPMIEGGNRTPTTAPDGDAGPGAVLGRLLVLLHRDAAVDLLDGDAGVVGADHAVGVQLTHELEVRGGVDRVAVDAEEQEHGLVRTSDSPLQRVRWRP